MITVSMKSQVVLLFKQGVSCGRVPSLKLKKLLRKGENCPKTPKSGRSGFVSEVWFNYCLHLEKYQSLCINHIFDVVI